MNSVLYVPKHPQDGEIVSSLREQRLHCNQTFSIILRLSLHSITYSICTGKLCKTHHEGTVQLTNKLCTIFTNWQSHARHETLPTAHLPCKMPEWRGKNERPYLSPCLMQGWHHGWTWDDSLDDMFISGCSQHQLSKRGTCCNTHACKI